MQWVRNGSRLGYAVGTEWVTPGLPRMLNSIKSNMRTRLNPFSLENRFSIFKLGRINCLFEGCMRDLTLCMLGKSSRKCQASGPAYAVQMEVLYVLGMLSNVTMVSKYELYSKFIDFHSFSIAASPVCVL